MNNINLLERIFGANWKTSLSAAATAIMGALTFLAGMSYDQGPLALVFPPAYKPKIAMIAGIATLILWIYNGVLQKSRDVTGGIVKQTSDGSVMAKSSIEDLANLPEYFELNGVRKRTADATPQELELVKQAVGITSITQHPL